MTAQSDEMSVGDEFKAPLDLLAAYTSCYFSHLVRI